jgi:hypothetical protein
MGGLEQLVALLAVGCGHHVRVHWFETGRGIISSLFNLLNFLFRCFTFWFGLQWPYFWQSEIGEDCPY